jgi:hypothetical protein
VYLYICACYIHVFYIYKGKQNASPAVRVVALGGSSSPAWR